MDGHLQSSVRQPPEGCEEVGEAGAVAVIPALPAATAPPPEGGKPEELADNGSRRASTIGTIDLDEDDYADTVSECSVASRDEFGNPKSWAALVEEQEELQLLKRRERKEGKSPTVSTEASVGAEIETPRQQVIVSVPVNTVMPHIRDWVAEAPQPGGTPLGDIISRHMECEREYLDLLRRPAVRQDLPEEPQDMWWDDGPDAPVVEVAGEAPLEASRQAQEELLQYLAAEQPEVAEEAAALPVVTGEDRPSAEGREEEPQWTEPDMPDVPEDELPPPSYGPGAEWANVPFDFWETVPPLSVAAARRARRNRRRRLNNPNHQLTIDDYVSRIPSPERARSPTPPPGPVHMPRHRRRWDQERLDRLMAVDLAAREDNVAPLEPILEPQAQRAVPARERVAAPSSSFARPDNPSASEGSMETDPRPTPKRRPGRRGEMRRRRYALRLEAASLPVPRESQPPAPENESVAPSEVRSEPGRGIQSRLGAVRRPPVIRPVRTDGIMFGGLDPIPTNPLIDPPPYHCFNCWQEGHSSDRCTRPKVRTFCDNCGRQGEDLRSCPRCSRVHKDFIVRYFGCEKVWEKELDRRHQLELAVEAEREERRKLEREVEDARKEKERAERELESLRQAREAERRRWAAREQSLLRLRRTDAPVKRPAAPLDLSLPKPPKVANLGETPGQLPPPQPGIWARVGPLPTAAQTSQTLREAAQQRASAELTLEVAERRWPPSVPCPPDVARRNQARRLTDEVLELTAEQKEALLRHLLAQAKFPGKER